MVVTGASPEPEPPRSRTCSRAPRARPNNTPVNLLHRRSDGVGELGQVMLPEQRHLMFLLGALQALEVVHSSDHSACNEVATKRHPPLVGLPPDFPEQSLPRVLRPIRHLALDRQQSPVE